MLMYLESTGVPRASHNNRMHWYSSESSLAGSGSACTASTQKSWQEAILMRSFMTLMYFSSEIRFQKITESSTYSYTHSITPSGWRTYLVFLSEAVYQSVREVAPLVIMTNISKVDMWSHSQSYPESRTFPRHCTQVPPWYSQSVKNLKNYVVLLEGTIDWEIFSRHGAL